MKNITFKAVTYEQWKQAAEQSLKGKTVESLGKYTYEQIQFKPLYMKDDLKEDNNKQTFPGFADYRRGIHSLGYKQEPWKVSQQLEASENNELRQKLLHALKNGQTAIAFQEIEQLVASEANFSHVLADVFTTFPFALRLNHTQQQFVSMLAKLVTEKNANEEQVSGFISTDPIAKLVAQGGLEASLAKTYDDWAKVIQLADKELPQVKTIGIDCSIYHNGGANAVQELAIALAVGVYHIEQFMNRGFTLEQIFPKMIFHFSIGANFFMEVAKLRAARVLWTKILEAYGASSELQKMYLSAETSIFTKTVYDPHVNMLRAANEAFAAVIGGVDYLHVGRFDETIKETSEFSERVARNTQLILKEEALLRHVIDPAGGSWFAESMTNELIEKAWKLFLVIDEQGGIVKTLQSGFLQAEVNKVKEKRLDDILTRKQSIVGTNKYANLAEEFVQVNKETVIEPTNPSFVEKVEQLQVGRLAVPFENLREKAQNLQAVVGLICLGELKDYKARADFTAGFLAAGGIQVEKSTDLYTNQDMERFIEKSELSHYVICGNEAAYREFDKNVLTKMKDNHPQLHFYLAGLPKEMEQQAWKTAGVSDFIHLKANCYDILAQLLTEMEGKKDDVKA